MSDLANHSAKILRCIADGVITTDTQGVISYMNPIAEKLTGVPMNEAVGRRFTELIQLHRDGDGETVFKNQRDELTSDHVAVMYASDGQQYSVSYSMTALEEDGKVTGYVIALHDLTNEYDLSKKLQWQMLHDNLTKTKNRQAFELRIQNILDGRYKEEFHSLIYIDIDYFKVVNERGGTEAGDKALKYVSKTLHEQLRDNDLLCRVGGDEFAIVLAGCHIRQAQEIGNRLRRTISEKPLTLGDKTFQITISAGLVPIGGPLNAMQDVINQASVCCDVARNKGGDYLYVYDDEQDGVQTIHSDITSAQDLQQAIEQESFALAWQFIRQGHAGAKYSGMYEFLVRLDLGEGKTLPAEQFISVAERYGLLFRLDQWVIKNAFAVMAAQSKVEDVLFCINLSSQTLADIHSLSFIQEQMNEYNIDPAKVCFEITEASVVNAFVTAKRLIDNLRELGCRFALDDFGAGLSSFANLKHFRVDFIKIDGELTRNMDNDRVDRAMVNTIHMTANDLGIATVAECIEAREVFNLLQDMNIDYLQGNVISEPMLLKLQIKH